MVRVVLVKSNRDAANCWRSLLEDAYEADPWEFQNMEKKLTLERFQREVSIFGGFDMAALHEAHSTYVYHVCIS